MEQEVKTLTSRLQEMESECQQLRERAQREHMHAVTDALTGAFNRSAYETRLAQEYARWKRYQTPFALLLWDIDGFKGINDTYGHAAGDSALKLIAGVLKENLRDADFTARYGGDEFAALLSETSLETALVVAEKVRTAVVESKFHHKDRPVAIALSCGIASIQNEDTPDTMFQRADAALYKAKHSGKNRCLSEKDI
jgi:diguanylate cyclase